MSFVRHWSVGVTGFALGERGDEEIIRWALDDEHQGRPIIGGLFPTMEVALRDKRLWHEAPIYGNFTFYGMLLMATAAKNAAGVDLYHQPADNGATICGIMEGMFSMAYPIEWTGVPGGSIRQITWGHGSTMTDRGISVEWHGLKKPAFDMVLGIAPEPEVLGRIQEAAGKR